jgi:hypothetical protein
MVAKKAMSVSLTPEDRTGLLKEKKRRTVLPPSIASLPRFVVRNFPYTSDHLAVTLTLSPANWTLSFSHKGGMQRVIDTRRNARKVCR